MKKLIYIMLGAIALMSLSCNDIDEGDRYIYVKPPEKGRKVLLEDYTGQRCLNCPKAADIIHELMGQYGGDTIIAVSIHGGPLAFKKAGNPKALANDLGDTYYKAFQLDHNPVGLINRHGASDFQAWKGLVYDEIQLKSPLDLDLASTFNEGNGSVEVTVNSIGTNGNTAGKLQLWVVEDSIVALQTMPDGTVNKEYVHNHVLRAAVNGDWGEDFAISEGQKKENKFHFLLDKGWVARHISIVAFVYNDNGVQQVSKTSIIQKQ